MKALSRLTPAELDAAIESGLRDLELLATFYDRRGNSDQAGEIRRAIQKMRWQIATRQRRDTAFRAAGF